MLVFSWICNFSYSVFKFSKGYFCLLLFHSIALAILIYLLTLKKNYLFWLHQVFLVACGIFICSMWDPALWPGIRLGSLWLGVWRPSHGTTREVRWYIFYSSDFFLLLWSFLLIFFFGGFCCCWLLHWKFSLLTALGYPYLKAGH